jgi:predicted nucleic acid-binding protein
MSSVVYADSSVLVAWFWPADVNGKAVNKWMLQRSPTLVYNAVHRLEVRHNLRQIKKSSYYAAAWHALRSAEGSGSRLRGYPVDLLGLLQRADQISAQFQGQLECGAIDLIHLAGAIEAGALFVTCDAAQAAAARLANTEHVMIGG